MLSDELVSRLRDHLARIYGDDPAARTLPRVLALLREFADAHPEITSREPRLFDQSDVVLIAYGDQVRESDKPPLRSLRSFLAAHAAGAVTGLHLLPHHPSSSDDGFAVADYTRVDPTLGDWDDVTALSDDFALMLDAVVNHTSASHPWYVRWQCRDPRYADYYIAVDPDTDLRGVTRPRTSPLLTPTVGDPEDRRWVWTTFSADQVDLNYGNPDVLLDVTAVLLDYVARGATRLRLDAVAFLWKQVGTNCIHLPQTHEVVKLWRTVMDAVAPGTLLITETNVPHRENLSYFGAGADEAHLIYQFALPPLTLATFHSGDAQALTDWARTLQAPSTQATFLNFLASHDGVGLRPVEGLLDRSAIEQMCAEVERGGGRVSYRSGPDGPSPYELNTVYFDALARGGEPEARTTQVDRFLAAHSILLSLAGVPALYFHSLFGSRNWAEGADHEGRARVINRQRFARGRLESELADPTSLRRQVLDRMLGRIRVRAADAAFHPNASQHVVTAGSGQFVVQRTPEAGGGTVVCVHDVSGRPGRCRVSAPDPLPAGARLVDLCDDSEHVSEADGSVDVDLPAYGVRWLRAH